MSANPLINSVRSYLASQNMFVDDDWLTGCVEYITEDPSNNYSVSELQNLAKEQWLLNDLKEICPGSLPAGLRNQQKTVLNGRFVLQVNAAIDIGTPAYQQYLKLQKVNTENIDATTQFDDRIPNHRMIKLYMTDGVQEVSGIEYQPMRNLNCDITPGCKVLVKGPVDCRRGVMLLTESAIELLGGEVQELALSHSLAGLIATKLGVTVTPESALNSTINQPRNIDIPAPHSAMPSRNDTNSDPDTFSRPFSGQPTRPIGQSVTSDWPMSAQNPAVSLRPTTQNQLATSQNWSTTDTRPIARVTSVQLSNFADDDIDIDQIAAIEARYHSPSASAKRPLPECTPEPDKKAKIDNSNSLEDYPTDNDIFLEDEEYLRELEAKFDAQEGIVQKGPKTVSPDPFVYIKQIKDLPESQKAGRVFKVKAQIIKLISKLSVGKDGWMLKCSILDGTGSMEVEFTSTVLSKLVGLTPQEMNLLKKQMATDPESKRKLISTLQKARDTLQVLYCIIELTMLEVPKITCLIPFQKSHVDSLKTRLQNTGL